MHQRGPGAGRARSRSRRSRIASISTAEIRAPPRFASLRSLSSNDSAFADLSASPGYAARNSSASSSGFSTSTPPRRMIALIPARPLATPRPRGRSHRLRRGLRARVRAERMPPARGPSRASREIPSSRSIASSDLCSPSKPKRSSSTCRSSSGNLPSAARTACLRNVFPASSTGSSASESAKSSPSSPSPSLPTV